MEGLSQKEVDQNLRKYGRNVIKDAKGVSLLRIFFVQFTSPLILVLISASFFSFFVNFYNQDGYFDSVLILLIVFISGISGFIQNYKAEKAVEALKKMTTPYAVVIRNGKQKQIRASQIVPYDIVVLSGGDVVPADSKIIKGKLEINESVLTGESRSVHKKNGDKIYSGCSVFSGNASVKVYATGMRTKIGEIASEMQNIKEEKSQFQKDLSRFTNKLVLFTGLIVIITFLVALQKMNILEAGLIAISLAVAAIPEGLPAVITLTLSLGSKRMTKKNALIRKLSTTESIGSVNIICTDKTGTLTKGDMTTSDVWLLFKNNKSTELARQCLMYCNNAELVMKNGDERWIGDETDVALKKYVIRYGEKHGEKIGEISFNSERKMMTVIQQINNDQFVFSKGAPEVLVDKCTKISIGDGVKKMSKIEKSRILQKNKDLASQGYRVLALSYKKSNELSEDNLVFLGLVYLDDPVRESVARSISVCKNAGIRIIMITGDNPLTAKSVADQIGISSKKVFLGSDIDKMDDSELFNILNGKNNIFARTNPFHKLKILKILQEQDNIVAMTGDGVNDALALKKADVGIAMGIKGTEVSKQASDIILLDDKFETIKNAIKEGRRIFDNIKKFINYLITCNLAEVIVILVAIIALSDPIFLPIHILWINLVTDGLVALSLSVDGANKDIMKRSPRLMKNGIIDKKLGISIIAIGIKKSILLLALLFVCVRNFDLVQARSIFFTAFVLFEFVRVFVIKHNNGDRTLKEYLNNKSLNYSLLVSFILQLIIIYTPISSYFGITSLGLVGWGLVMVVLITGAFAGVGINKIVDMIYSDGGRNKGLHIDIAKKKIDSNI